MIATSAWRPATTQFEAQTASSHALLFDTDAAHTLGPSPMEAVLAALCACTSVDVVSILQKKREPLTSLVVTAEAEQAPAPPRVFTHITLTYRVGGALSRKAVEDAVSLSKEKYCSVSIMLAPSVRIDYVIEYADENPAP
ncbi:MAG TPA: OsmC family protein [Acidobacteriaceae bacterium]